MIRVLHVSGNEFNLSNGIGRLLSQLVSNQNSFSSVID